MASSSMIFFFLLTHFCVVDLPLLSNLLFLETWEIVFLYESAFYVEQRY